MRAFCKVIYLKLAYFFLCTILKKLNIQSDIKYSGYGKNMAGDFPGE